MLPFFGCSHRTRLQSFVPDRQHTLTLSPEDIVTLASVQGNNYYRPWLKNLMKAPSKISSNRNKFQVNLDVQHFAPDELTVKAADGFLIVEGKHEEKRDDHGWVTREFKRRYELPNGCDIRGVQSRLSSDGVLTIDAPLERLSPNERIVPITPTGPVRTEATDSKTEIAGPGGEAAAIPAALAVPPPVANGQ